VVFIDGIDRQNGYRGNASNNAANLPHIIAGYRSLDDRASDGVAREQSDGDAKNSATHFRSNEN
jgi:hypothetical protein